MRRGEHKGCTTSGSSECCGLTCEVAVAGGIDLMRGQTRSRSRSWAVTRSAAAADQISYCAPCADIP